MKEKKTGKRKKWIKTRHNVIVAIARFFMKPYICWKFGVKIDKFKEQGNRKYLVIMNHQTAFDQFFVSLSFKGHIYYIATEDIFSMGWISKLLRWAVAPIPIKKQTTDVHAVMNCMRVSKEGGTIALAPEGNRTYCGRTVYMKPSIVKLVRALKVPLAIYRIEGGYGVQPRWTDVVRKGKMHAGVSKVIEPEEYKKLTDDELFELIKKELYVDEACAGGTFYHKKSAEYLERAIYVCRSCGFSEFESHGDLFTCKKCGETVRYLPTKELQGIHTEFPFPYVGQWYDYQCDFINRFDSMAHTEKPLYQDVAEFSEVILYKNKQTIKKDVTVSLYGDRIEIDGGYIFPFEATGAVAVLGRNKLNIYFEEHVYQLKGSERFNALKYVNFYHRYTNIKEGNPDGEFLGL